MSDESGRGINPIWSEIWSEPNQEGMVILSGLQKPTGGFTGIDAENSLGQDPDSWGENTAFISRQ